LPYEKPRSAYKAEQKQIFFYLSREYALKMLDRALLLWYYFLYENTLKICPFRFYVSMKGASSDVLL